jgi:MerR family transcriptional regulator/heat shock protein HspR
MATKAKKKGAKAGYMISAVAEMFHLHPQTLRLYEREGLLTPSRSEGNTRLYTQDDLERLEVILSLTRDLGVNLAGIEVILNMRKRMDSMQKEMQAFVDFVNRAFMERAGEISGQPQNALVRASPTRIIRAMKKQ